MKSIRRGLLLWVTGTLVLGVLAVALATYYTARCQIDATVYGELRQLQLEPAHALAHFFTVGGAIGLAQVGGGGPAGTVSDFFSSFVPAWLVTVREISQVPSAR